MSKPKLHGNTKRTAKPTLAWVRRLFRRARTISQWATAQRAADGLSTPDRRAIQREASAAQHRIVVAVMTAMTNRAFDVAGAAVSS